MGRAPHKHPIFLLSVVVSSIACTLAYGPRTQEQIDTICRQMEDYGFCNKCFSEHIFTPDADMTALAQIAIEQSLANASNTLILAKKAWRDATDQELVGYLKTCIDGYLQTLDLIENADRVFGSKNYRTVLINFLNSAKVQATQCGQYSNKHGIQNPLYEYNREERILVTMGVATADSLLRGRRARHLL
ncbi:hypothetical protein EUGRSUZ_E00366 [Eucalyptus grandis]|uniref:Uncharacterized protein n=2 Tax=Eucalyptus grandis TaxID=71139 RepID=A0ACC3KSD6_EUCGR|nr:hypothetical protein EUGRSUZ_E00366 [Eucalyptus grandis]